MKSVCNFIFFSSKNCELLLNTFHIFHLNIQIMFLSFHFEKSRNIVGNNGGKLSKHYRLDPFPSAKDQLWKWKYINVFCVKSIQNRKRETDWWRFMTMLVLFVVFQEEKSFAFYPNYTFSVRLTNKERTTFLCLQHLADLNQEVYHISSKDLEEWIV